MSVREGASATTHLLNMVSYRDMRPSCPAAAQALQQQRKRQYNEETMQLDPKPVVNQARRIILRRELRADGIRAPALRRQHIRPDQDVTILHCGKEKGSRTCSGVEATGGGGAGCKRVRLNAVSKDKD